MRHSTNDLIYGAIFIMSLGFHATSVSSSEQNTEACERYNASKLESIVRLITLQQDEQLTNCFQKRLDQGFKTIDIQYKSQILDSEFRKQTSNIEKHNAEVSLISIQDETTSRPSINSQSNQQAVSRESRIHIDTVNGYSTVKHLAPD